MARKLAFGGFLLLTVLALVGAVFAVVSGDGLRIQATVTLAVTAAACALTVVHGETPASLLANQVGIAAAGASVGLNIWACFAIAGAPDRGDLAGLSSAHTTAATFAALCVVWSIIEQLSEFGSWWEDDGDDGDDDDDDDGWGGFFDPGGPDGGRENDPDEPEQPEDDDFDRALREMLDRERQMASAGV